MCVVSAVMDYGQRVWPQSAPNSWPPITQPQQIRDEHEAIKRFMKLVDAAKEFDKAASQPHCEDAEKIKLLERLEQRLAAIEAKLGIEPTA